MKLLRTLTAITLLVPYFSFVMPKQNPILAAGKGNCAEGYFEDLGTEIPGTIIKDENWDGYSTKTFTAASGNVISMVFIKSGAKEGFCLTPITEDGSYNDGHYIVSGVGTNRVTVTENGGQDVSHTEFVITTSTADPTCTTGTPAWAYSVVDANQNGTVVASNRRDVSDVLGQADSVDGTEGTFYSLGFGGYITIAFANPINDVAGHDFEIREVTWGGTSGRLGHKEAAMIEVSPDGILWAKVADIDNQSSDGISGIDFASSNFEWVKYVRITDTTKTVYPTSTSTDGFDIDSILGLSGTCGEIDEENLEWGVIRGYKCEDLDGDGDFMVGHYTDVEREEAEVYERCVSENLGLNGWTINLYAVVEGQEVFVESKTTDTGVNGKNGYYEFTELDINKVYRLREVEDKEGWIRTRPSELNFGRDYHVVNFANVYANKGSFVTGRNFGNYRVTESTVSLCKEDEKENRLEGWNLSLTSKDPVATVDVPSRLAGQNQNQVVSMNLEAGTYILVASGTYEFWNWGPTDDVEGIADAGYSRRPNLSTEDDLEDYLWVNGDDLGAGWEGYLEVRVDNTNVNWGDFNNDHVYELVYVHDGGNLDFAILDSYYGDNSGAINVKAYRIYDGVTNNDGCVAFENIDFGNYVVGETVEDAEKWVNVSGLGDVTVDETEEQFVVVNNYIDPVDLVIEKSESDEDNTVVARDTLTYAIRFANIGEDTAHNVVIEETVPAGTTYTGDEGWVCEATPAVAGTVCRYNVGDLAGQNTTAELAEYMTITFTVTVNADVTEETVIENTAVISSDEEEEITENNEDSADDVEIGEVAGTEEENEEEEEEPVDNNDNEENDEENEGEVAGENTTTTPKQEVLGASTSTGSVQGASTELAETGTRYALIVAGLGLVIFAGSSVALLRKKK